MSANADLVKEDVGEEVTNVVKSSHLSSPLLRVHLSVDAQSGCGRGWADQAEFIGEESRLDTNNSSETLSNLAADISRLHFHSDDDDRAQRQLSQSQSLSPYDRANSSSECGCRSSDQLNQYWLHHAIGHGSYGIVKLAYNVSDNTHYAMKIIDKSKLMQRAGMFVSGRTTPVRKGSGNSPASSPSSSIDPLKSVYREIAILKKLSHPNVVRLVDVLDDPRTQHERHGRTRREYLYLVFELLERGPVLEVPTEKPLTESAARRYFGHVVLGIEYLHYQKVIHRDIKPANLLLSDHDTVKIADFGVCNEFSGRDALLTGTCGSPAFLPPEALQTTRCAYSGRCADLWAMGVTLYALVTGQLPFHDSNALALHHRIRSEPPQPPPPQLRSKLSQPLWHLILGLLDKEPNTRFTLSELRQHPWLTESGSSPLPPVEVNCRSAVHVTEDEVQGCVRTMGGINTVILVKSMFRHRSFLHPFRGARSRSEELRTRSNSAPSIVD